LRVSHLTHYLLFFCSIASGFPFFGQNPPEIEFVTSRADKPVLQKFLEAVDFSADQDLNEELHQLLRAFQKEGYLLASVDQLTFKDTIPVVKLHVGKRYKWAYLDPGSIDEALLNKLGFGEKFLQGRPFKYPQVNRLMNKILTHYENNGRPFASVRLDSMGINNGRIRARIQTEPGPLITFDSVRVMGNAKIKAGYLANYLRIIPGRPYQARLLSQATKKIQQLPYLELNGPIETTFQNNQATVYLDVINRKSNRIDLLLGLLPNESTEGTLLLTGKVDLALQNMFGSGKSFKIYWERLREETSQLELDYYHPNLLRSMINGRMRFHLLKEDSTFLNREFGVEFSYQPKVHSTYFFDFELKSSNLINPEDFNTSEEFPLFSDTEIASYGIGYQYQNLDNPVNPRRGFRFGLQSKAGNKEIEKRNTFDSQFYDSLDLKSLQLTVTTSLEYHYPLFRSLGLYGKFSGGFMENDQLFLNEMFRVGGLQDLRGFNENFFFASKYGLSNMEVRYFLDTYSHLFLFYDHSYLTYRINKKKIDDDPFGIGAGLRLQLKNGEFNFVYAFGNSETQQLGLSLSKVHFGYTSRF